MSESVQLREGYTSMLDALLYGTNAHVHLYTNDPPLTADTVKDDLVELVMEGYAAQGVKKWMPAMLRYGRAFSVCDPLVFARAPDAAPSEVRGYYVTFGPDGPVMWAWRRPGDPFTFTEETPAVMIYVKVTWPLVCP